MYHFVRLVGIKMEAHSEDVTCQFKAQHRDDSLRYTDMSSSRNYFERYPSFLTKLPYYLINPPAQLTSQRGSTPAGDHHSNVQPM